MKRNLTQLKTKTYDLLVIGGGIYGANIAWDAVLRGLSVALVEKEDFGHATSANSLKTVHGGLRYLQHADLKRMRESIRERRTLMRIAPHLVHPLPCLMPTYGHNLKGREVMTVALLINDIISFDRNRSLDSNKHLPRGRVISKQECLEILPDIDQKNLTGAAIWYDGQMYNSERLTLSFVLSAAAAGADVANYTEVVGFVEEDNRVVGAKVKDNLSGEEFNIRANMVVNAAGPWTDRVLQTLNESNHQLDIQLAKAINLVTFRPIFKDYAVAISSRNNKRDADALVDKGSPLLFVSPWRNRSMVGTIYIPYKEHPNNLSVTHEDINGILEEINRAYPVANLTYEDISFVHCGLVPINGVDSGTGAAQRAKQYRIYNHRQEGISGLITVLGVKYTTARDVAKKVIDLVFEEQGLTFLPCRSDVTPLYGGDITEFTAYLEKEMQVRRCGLSPTLIQLLIYNYGTAYQKVLHYFDRQSYNQALPDEFAVLKAEVVYGIKEEMAQRLSDVLFRRTELGSDGHPGCDKVNFCAEIMAKELGWSPEKTTQEIEAVNKVFEWNILRN